MKGFDKIIGYKTIKQQLVRTCDVVKNYQKYSHLGVHVPHGMLLEGKPGVGKTLMANCFIAECERPVFVCRKNKSDNEFVEHIKSVFEEAKQNAPSIVLLDDIDKFSNDDYDSCDSQEFVTVQSCIDEIGKAQVFVIATANDTRYLPDSLIRAGRFDIRITVEAPEPADAKEIVEHYLAKKQCIDSIALEDAAELLVGRTCAEIESIINGAAILAGYAENYMIEYDDIVKSFLEFTFKGKDSGSVPSNVDSRRHIAYHEAGHVVVTELLFDGGTALATIGNEYNLGMTMPSPLIAYSPTVEFKESKGLIALGGRAAVEVALGEIDVGASDDIKKAMQISSRIVDDTCIHGFATYDAFRDLQPIVETRNELLVIERVEEWYLRVKKMLVQNRPLLDGIARALIEKSTITKHDIARIKADLKQEKTSAGSAEFDEMYLRAVRLCADKKQCSVPFLQRNLRIGFHMAAELVDRMITDGLISDKYDASKKTYEFVCE